MFREHTTLVHKQYYCNRCFMLTPDILAAKVIGLLILSLSLFIIFFSLDLYLPWEGLCKKSRLLGHD